MNKKFTTKVIAGFLGFSSFIYLTSAVSSHLNFGATKHISKYDIEDIKVDESLIKRVNFNRFFLEKRSIEPNYLIKISNDTFTQKDSKVIVLDQKLLNNESLMKNFYTSLNYNLLVDFSFFHEFYHSKEDQIKYIDAFKYIDKKIKSSLIESSADIFGNILTIQKNNLNQIDAKKLVEANILYRNNESRYNNNYYDHKTSYALYDFLKIISNKDGFNNIKSLKGEEIFKYATIKGFNNSNTIFSLVNKNPKYSKEKDAINITNKYLDIIKNSLSITFNSDFLTPGVDINNFRAISKKISDNQFCIKDNILETTKCKVI